MRQGQGEGGAKEFSSWARINESLKAGRTASNNCINLRKGRPVGQEEALGAVSKEPGEVRLGMGGLTGRRLLKE